MATLKDWKNREGLSDEEILTTKYLTRISDEPPPLETVYCACGCGKFWLKRRDQVQKQRFVRGHSPRRKPRTRKKIMQLIRDALPVMTYETAYEISKKSGVDSRTCQRYLNDFKSELGVQVILGISNGYRKKGAS